MRQLEHHEHRPRPHHGRRVEVALDALKDPLNVGQAFRICASLGVRHLHLCAGTPTPPLAKINRTARGAQHQLPWSATEQTLDVVAGFRQSGRVLGVELATGSVDVRERAVTGEAVLLVVGNEAHGLAPELLDACDEVVHLPLYGAISSLNVATALALAVWEAVR